MRKEKMRVTSRLAMLRIGRYDLDLRFGGSRASGFVVVADAGISPLVIVLFEVI
jgi:hypothetical protein